MPESPDRQNGISAEGETHRTRFNTAEPPEEVVAIIKQQGLPEDAIQCWMAVPSLRVEDTRLSNAEICENGRVDIYKRLEPFLGNKILDGTLRTVDVLNGCGHHCDTCVADSKLPSTIMSFESIASLFSDERFLRMLQSDSLRFGSSGDLLEHPQAVEIVRIVLEKTESLEKKRLSSEGKHHQIKIYTNYRPNCEAALDELIGIARKYPDRLCITISTPMNAKDTVNKKWDEYVFVRPEIFGTSYVRQDKDGLKFYGWGKTVLPNVSIHDVRHPYPLLTSGRTLSDELLEKKVPKSRIDRDSAIVDRDKRIYYDYINRGLAKTYLNSDGLWLMIYATQYESHTARVFTPITPENLGALSHIPYHPDFPIPPNWPGGQGAKKYYAGAGELQKKAKQSGKTMKDLTIIE